ncbi:MAG: HAD family phosphatase [Blautia sp.]|nr:HAD family phosphatase [Blautia sp.]
MGDRAYKNIIFDVGNVLIGFRWEDMLMKDHGMSEEAALSFGNMIFSDPLWKEFDLAVIPYEEVIERYVKNYPDYEADIRWFFSHTELMSVPRPRVWEKVGRLKQAGYAVYLLSNYSRQMLGTHTGGAAFHDYLDGGVISYQVHVIKPDEQIYRKLLEKYGLSARESIFFDDRSDNVEAALALGMGGIVVTDEQQLIKELERLIRQREDC